jgi:hypothetical protein
MDREEATGRFNAAAAGGGGVTIGIGTAWNARPQAFPHPLGGSESLKILQENACVNWFG